MAGDDFLKRAYNAFLSQGWAPHQAAALAGHAKWESGGSTTIEDPRGEGSRGLFQWRLDRRKGLYDFAKARGFNPDDENTQLAYANWELTEGPEKRWGDALRNAPDLGAANDATMGFLRPAGWTAANPRAGHGYQNRYTLSAGLVDAPPEYIPPVAPTRAVGGPPGAPLMSAADAAQTQTPAGGAPPAGDGGPAARRQKPSSLDGLARNGLAVASMGEAPGPTPPPQAPPAPIYRPNVQQMPSLVNTIFGQDQRRNPFSLFG